MAVEKLQIIVEATDQASGVFKKLASETKGFGGLLGGALRLGALGAAGAVAGLGTGLAALAGFTASAIPAASDLQETISKTQVIFGDAADEVLSFSETASSALGQSEVSALDAAATFGVFGKAAGLTGSDLAGFSTELTQLASDLASFHNTSPEQAITALGAALRGETEPMRAYGVLLDDMTMRQKALELGITDSIKNALTPQQKVLAAHALIMEQTADAQGDFARTSTGLANVQRTIKAQITDLSATWGSIFLPVAEKVANIVSTEVLPALKDIAVRTGEIVEIFQTEGIEAGLSELFGAENAQKIIAVGEAISGFAQALKEGDISGAFDAVSASLGRFLPEGAGDRISEFGNKLEFLVTKAGEVKAAFEEGGLAAAIGAVFGEEAGAQAATILTRLDDLKIKAGEVASAFREGGLVEAISTAFGEEAGQRVFDFLARLDELKTKAQEVVAAFQEGGLQAALDSLFGEDIGGRIGEAINLFSSFGEQVKTAFSDLVANSGPLINQFKQLFASIGPLVQSALPVIGAVIGGIIALFSGLVGAVSNALGPFLQMLSGIVQGVVQMATGIIQQWTGLFDIIVGLVTGNADLINQGWESIKAGAQQAFEGAKQIVTSLVSGLVDTVLAMIDGFVGGVVDMFAALTGDTADAWENIKSAITEKAREIKTQVETWAKSIPQIIRGLASKLREAGVAAFQGLLSGIQSKIQEIRRWIEENIAGLADKVKSVLGIRSPSKVFAEIGEQLGAGFLEGLESLVKSYQDVIDRIWVITEEEWAKIGEKVVEVLEMVDQAFNNFARGSVIDARREVNLFIKTLGNIPKRIQVVINVAMTGSGLALLSLLGGGGIMAGGSQGGGTGVPGTPGGFGIQSVLPITRKNYFKIGEEIGRSLVFGLRTRLGPYREAIGEFINVGQQLGAIAQSFGDFLTKYTIDPLRSIVDEGTSKVEKLGETVKKSLLNNLKEAGDLAEDSGLRDFIENWTGESIDQIEEMRNLIREEGFGSEDDLKNLQAMRDILSGISDEKERITELEELTLGIQRRQDQLNYLKAQFDLIQMIRANRLDPKQVLGDFRFGVDADPVSFLQAMGRAMDEMINQTHWALKEFEKPEMSIATFFAEAEDSVISLGDSLQLIEGPTTKIIGSFEKAEGKVKSFTSVAFNSFEELGSFLIDKLFRAIDDRVDDLKQGFQELFGLAGPISGLANEAIGRFRAKTLDPMKKSIDTLDSQLQGLIDKFMSQNPAWDWEQWNLRNPVHLNRLINWAKNIGWEEGAKQLSKIFDLLKDVNMRKAQYNALERETLELQKAQEDLNFLKQQFELLQLIRDNGLNPDEILGGLTLGLNADMADIIKAMTAAMQALVKKTEEELGIHSPSRVFFDFGRRIMQGLAEGIEYSSRAVQRTIGRALPSDPRFAFAGAGVPGGSVHNYNLTINTNAPHEPILRDFDSMRAWVKG